MKKFIKYLTRQVQAYVNFHAQPTTDINLKTHKIITTIRQAEEKQLALHAIYQGKSFTGDLVKYDPKKDKLILKNFQRNLSLIIAISDINRLTLIPPTVRKSQTLEKNERP